MTDVVKAGERQAAAQTLPEVEFALILSRTIDALNEDPSLLRNTVYEMARSTLTKDLFDSDPDRGQRLAQALETAIRGVEDFSVRQNGGIIRGRPIAGPMGQLLDSGRLAPPQFPNPEVYPPHAGAALPVIQIDHPAFETARAGWEPAGSISTKRDSSSLSWRMVLFGLCVVPFIVLAGIVADRALTSGFLRGGSVSSKLAPGIAPSQITPDQMAAIYAPMPPAPPPIPGLPLPTSYGNYVVKDGQLTELQLLDGQVPDKRVAISAPIHTPSHTVLPDGSPTFVIFRRDLASIPTDSIEARVVAKISQTMKVDSQTRQASYTPEELWSVRPFTYKFRSAPVPGNPEMILIKPEDGVVLPPGRYALVLKRQGYDFTVAGEITDPNQCLERTEATNGIFYSPCSKIR